MTVLLDKFGLHQTTRFLPLAVGQERLNYGMYQLVQRCVPSEVGPKLGLTMAPYLHHFRAY